MANKIIRDVHIHLWNFWNNSKGKYYRQDTTAKRSSTAYRSSHFYNSGSQVIFP